jgi:16S rRNA (cytidine1402-2'-O)-methyltransferase
MAPNSSTGTLTIVSTHIGNPLDMSERAKEVIRTCDILLVEDRKPAGQLLKSVGIRRDVVLYNEHTYKDETNRIIDELLGGKSVALVSDSGTPLIADPGSELVEKAAAFGITVTAVPGASSILAALVTSGVPADRFTFAGFLPRDKKERIADLRSLRNRKETIILLEAPYRLLHILSDVQTVFGSGHPIVIAVELTMKNERIYRMNAQQAVAFFTAHPFKGEFVIVLPPTN